MTDPCKDCWPRVDPYECWGCQNVTKHYEYVQKLLSCEVSVSESFPNENDNTCENNIKEES